MLKWLKYQDTKVKVLCFISSVSILLCVLTVCILQYRNRMASYTGSKVELLQSDVNPDVAEPIGEKLVPDSGNQIDFGQSEVIWNGKEYRRNTYIKPILCIGVDRKNVMTETKELGEAGQADSIFLIAQDTARNQLKILMIPRDTMTEIQVIDPDGNIYAQTDHLLMAYAYGDGKESSCQNMADSVTKLFKGLPIDHYLATETTMIGALNDAIGGVTVTVPTPGMEKADPAFIQGEAITLKGDQAELFVRYRDIELDHSAIFRMNQQKEYIIRFFETLQNEATKDSQIVSKLFAMVEDYMVTDMEKDQYLRIALDALESGDVSGESFYIVPGKDITTEQFDEYHVNEEEMIQLLLELFYREV